MESRRYEYERGVLEILYKRRTSIFSFCEKLANQFLFKNAFALHMYSLRMHYFVFMDQIIRLSIRFTDSRYSRRGKLDYIDIKKPSKAIFHLRDRDSQNNTRNYLRSNPALFAVSVEDSVKQRNTD